MNIKEQHKRFVEKSQLIYQSTHLDICEETATERKKRIAFLLANPKNFVEYYLPHYATAQCADFQLKLAKQVEYNPAAKIIVRWGRGLAKSVWCTLIIPLILLLKNKTKYMVVVGNNFDKAKILLSDLQAELLNNQRLIADFGEFYTHGSWEEGYFTTKNGFTAKALGMGQSPRGLRIQAQRPDYIVCDDLEDKDVARNPRRQDNIVEWIEQDLLPTMDGTNRRYLHSNNNYAPRSIQEELRLKHPEWTLNQVNAYDPITYQPAWNTKYEPEYYKEVESEIGALAARAEYNNQPHIQGKIFTEEQIQWTKLPALNRFAVITGFWDIAYAGTPGSDYNAVRLWGLYSNNFYYIDSFVEQCKMAKAVEWIAQQQLMLPVNIVIHWRFEAQFWNDEVERTIRECEKKYNIFLNLVKVDNPKQRKYDRLESMQPRYQNQRMYYNIDKKAHKSTIIGLQQLYGIEPGYRTKDDAPDADQQAVTYLERFIKRQNSQTRTGRFNRSKNRVIN